ncbi:MAG: cupin domain-containing protein [Pseudomonadota bacterium]
MKAIQPHERRVANIRDEAAYRPYDPEGVSEQGTSFIKLNDQGPRDVGFYIYRMEPGSRSTPHRHGGAEEFLMIEGELIDNDGTVYRAGDVVWLAGGTEHTSHTETGCLIAVYAEASEEPPQ